MQAHVCHDTLVDVREQHRVLDSASIMFEQGFLFAVAYARPAGPQLSRASPTSVSHLTGGVLVLQMQLQCATGI